MASSGGPRWQVDIRTPVLLIPLEESRSQLVKLNGFSGEPIGPSTKSSRCAQQQLVAEAPAGMAPRHAGGCGRTLVP